MTTILNVTRELTGKSTSTANRCNSISSRILQLWIWRNFLLGSTTLFPHSSGFQTLSRLTIGDEGKLVLPSYVLLYSNFLLSRNRNRRSQTNIWFEFELFLYRALPSQVSFGFSLSSLSQTDSKSDQHFFFKFFFLKFESVHCVWEGKLETAWYFCISVFGISFAWIMCRINLK